MGREEFEMPMHKVGIKLLADKQIRNVLPSYENLLDRIKKHREEIGKLNGEKFRHYQYNMMYDNVFSVYGKRGTGKTSVAFTLQKSFWDDREHSYDVVMPIIIPEVIPADCSALGWLLEIVREKISELFEGRRALACNNIDTDDWWRKCKNQGRSDIYEMLFKKYEDLEELYYSLKYNPSRENSYTLAVSNSARQVRAYYRLSKEIAEFWDCLVEAIRYKYSEEGKGKNDKKISPLIYFIFDDVDLAPEKVNELTSIIIKYLSHPNIIVITTADEETVLEVVENNLDKNIGRIPKEWRHYLNLHEYQIQNEHGNNGREEAPGNDRNDLIGRMARLYLGKVMPTSTRYYLKCFERADEKWRFWIYKEQQLGEAVEELLNNMLEKIGVQGKNFLKVQDTELDFYLNFFGDTSRQIGNTFLGMQEFLKEIQVLLAGKEKNLNESEQETLYESCRHFMQIALTANHSLAEILENVDEFISEIFWLEHNNWKFYISYKYLCSFLKELTRKEKKETVLWATLQLYSLMLFVENILVIIDYWAENRVTGRHRVHGVTGMADFMCEQVFQGKQKLRTDWSAEEFFRHYSMTLNRICYLSGLESSPEKFDREYLYYFLDYSYSEEVGKETLLTALEANRDWLGETAGTLSAVYGNVYLIGVKEINNCLTYREKHSLCRYQRTIDSILQVDLRKCLSEFDVKERAEREVEVLEKIPEEVKGGNSGKYSERLREELREKIEDAVIDELLAEYLDTHKDSYLDIRGKNDKEEAFWNEFWESYDESLNSEYLKRRAVPLYEVISKIDEQCEKDSLEKLLRKLPEGIVKLIVHCLQGDHGKDRLLLSLNVMQNFLIQWDQKEHYIIFEDPDSFLKLAADIGNQGDYYIEILNTANYIREEVPGWATKGRYCSMDDRTRYMTLRESLKNMYLLSKSGENRSKGSRSGIYSSMDKLGKTFDIAVDLEDKGEFKDAVNIGLVVQVMKRIQKLYLYQTVIEKYNLRDNNSSVRLERARIKKRTDKDAGKEKNSYYYAMFLTMKEILRRERVKGTDEEETLKNFVERAVWESRNQYLTKLIDEVKNESNAD